MAFGKIIKAKGVVFQKNGSHVMVTIPGERSVTVPCENPQAFLEFHYYFLTMGVRA